jgi:hypothetical protein
MVLEKIYRKMYEFLEKFYTENYRNMYENEVVVFNDLHFRNFRSFGLYKLQV